MFIFVFLLLIAVVPSLAQPVVSIPDTVLLGTGTIIVPVRLETPTESFVASELTIEYDPSLLTIVASKGPLLEEWLFVQNHTVSGIIRTAAATVSNEATVSGDLLLLAVTFLPDATSSVATLSITRAIIVETEAITIDGSVTRIGVGATIAANPFIQGLNEPSGWRDTVYVEVIEPGLTIQPIVVVSVGADAEVVPMMAIANGRFVGMLPTVYSASAQPNNGVLQVSIAPDQTQTIHIRRMVGDEIAQQTTSTLIGLFGDASQNGKVDVIDASLVLDMAVGKTPKLPQHNVDDGADISSNDATLILQKVIGIIDLFPVQSSWVE